jgi:hypothetical protein
MSDAFIYDDNLVTTAFRLNWDRARHIEIQRIRLLAVYVAIAIAVGFVGIHPGDPFVRLGALVLGFCVTVIISTMTNQLSNDLVNQLAHADRCARRLVVQTVDGRNEFIALHGFVGFPRKPFVLFGLVHFDMRLTFNVFYATIALAWLLQLGYLVFRMLVPGAVL